MFRIALKGALARRLRLALTAASIVIGVGFVAGTLVLTDTLNATFDQIFGNASKGMRAASLGAAKFERDDPLYVSSLRTTRCDSSGSFSFTQVPDGVWYVTSSVKWQGASQVEGGSMMQRVELRDGRQAKVTLP